MNGADEFRFCCIGNKKFRHCLAVMVSQTYVTRCHGGILKLVTHFIRGYFRVLLPRSLKVVFKTEVTTLRQHFKKHLSKSQSVDV